MTRADLTTVTTGRRILYHSGLNFLGAASPLLVALVAIPLLIDALGTARFGVLTLVWVLIGYLSVVDLGIGRALTKLVAERLGGPNEDEVPPLVGTALTLMFGVGILASLGLAFAAPRLVATVLNVPPALQSETVTAFVVVALALPVVTLTTGLRGVLEAHHRFELVNAVRIPLGAFTFAGPLLVLPWTTELPAIVGVLLAGRVAGAVAHWYLIDRAAPGLRRSLTWRRELAAPLLRFGGWMTVSNVLSPLMVYFDRFLIGAVLSMAAVAFYATPYEIATRLWLIPGALLSVLFPAFAAGMKQQPERVPHLFGRSVLVVLLLVAPITLVLVAFAEPALNAWVGEEFALHGTVVLQWLAVGVLINSLAQVPFTGIQAAGRPDLTAKLHLCEVPLYLLLLGWLTLRYGIQGAAIAWVVRVAIDAVALFVVAGWLFPRTVVWFRWAGAALPAVLVLIGVAAVLPSNGVKLAYVAIVGALLMALTATRLVRVGPTVAVPVEAEPAREGVSGP